MAVRQGRWQAVAMSGMRATGARGAAAGRRRPVVAWPERRLPAGVRTSRKRPAEVVAAGPKNHRAGRRHRPPAPTRAAALPAGPVPPGEAGAGRPLIGRLGRPPPGSRRPSLPPSGPSRQGRWQYHKEEERREGPPSHRHPRWGAAPAVLPGPRVASSDPPACHPCSRSPSEINSHQLIELSQKNLSRAQPHVRPRGAHPSTGKPGHGSGSSAHAASDRTPSHGAARGGMLQTVRSHSHLLEERGRDSTLRSGLSLNHLTGERYELRCVG